MPHKDPEKRREYQKERNQRPDKKAKDADRMRRYRATPEGKAKEAERMQRRRATAGHKAKEAERDRRRRDDPDESIKQRARKAVNNAVAYGKLVRLPCQVCGSTESQAHHNDYAKPLEVEWLCHKHHVERHTTNH